MPELAPGLPVGRAGGSTPANSRGFYLEIDDATDRPAGTGGCYVLLWNDTTGYDDWYELASHVTAAFASGHYGTVARLTDEESRVLQGWRRHGTT